MEYCVLVKLSKKTIEFRYQIDRGEVECLALSDKEQEIPLAFYLNGDEFIMGKYAVERVKMNDSNAYFPYFDLIREPGKTFIFRGAQRPIKQLLYLGVESCLSDFLRNKLILQDSSIDSNRANIPLRFCFNRDISAPEKEAVLSLFRETGYQNVDVVETDMMLFDTISNNNKSKLVLTGLDGDLYMNYFASKTDKCEMSRMLEGVGSDPRYRICADLLFNEITVSNPYIFIDKESNYESFLKEAVVIFDSNLPIVMGSIRLLSGESCDYSINRAILNDRLKQMSASLTLLSETEYLLQTINVGANDVDIILDGGVNTDFFVEKLHEKFPCVYPITPIHQRKIWMNIFAGIDLRPPKIVIPNLPDNNAGSRAQSSPGLPGPVSSPRTQGPPGLPGQNNGLRTQNPPGLPTNQKSGLQGPPPVPGIKGSYSKTPPPPPPSRPAVPSQSKKTTPPPPPPASPKKEKGLANQVLGNIIESGKKGLGGIGDKVKTAGIKGGVIAGIKSVVANLSDKVIVVGRDGEQKIPITQPTVEKEHCTLKLLSNGRVEVEDLSSRQGTFINDVRITKAIVKQDDIIRLGPSFKIKVKDLLVTK